MSNTSTDRHNRVLALRHGRPLRFGEAKLEIAVEPELVERTVMFTLDRHLPGEHGSSYFVYQRAIIPSGSAVKNPLAAKCESPQPRTFLTGLQNQGSLEVLSFGLTQVQLHYSSRVSHERVVRLFVTACAAALSLQGKEGEGEGIAVVTLE